MIIVYITTLPSSWMSTIPRPIALDCRYPLISELAKNSTICILSVFNRRGHLAFWRKILS